MQETIPGTGVYTVDADYQREGLASIHLMVDGDQLAIVDTGTQYSLPRVEQALAQLGKSWASVRYIILTHIHLDHAGGASAMLSKAPQAKVVVHKRGSRHMAAPEKLIAGSIAVYGQELFAEMYGQIHPIPESSLLVPDEDTRLPFGSRVLQFIDTPGHARHHYCIWDSATQSMFTGDTLGVAYPALSDGNNRFLMPSTTPIQFDPDPLHASIDKVMSFKPEQLYLTHFGGIRPTAELIVGLHKQIDDFVRITEEVAKRVTAETGNTDKISEQISGELKEYLLQRCCQQLPSLSQETITAWTQYDAELNAQGLAHWWLEQNQP